jgi:hypothetical protein
MNALLETLSITGDQDTKAVPLESARGLFGDPV